VNGRPGALTVVGRPEGKRVRLKSPRSWGFSKAASVCTPIRRVDRTFDLGPRGIGVNGIAPGATLTHALKKRACRGHRTPDAGAYAHPMSGAPQDMANAAPFLCSPAAAWISGQNLRASGGGVRELG